MSPPFRLGCRTLLCAVLVAQAMQAQSTTSPPRLTSAVRAAVIDSAVANLQRTYVDADTARAIGERLRARLAAGAYDGLDQAPQFAESVTRDLRSVNGDLHLSLRYVPAAAQQGAAGAMGGDPRSQNFGLARLEILDGNVGYLEITAFMGAPGNEAVVADALRFLARTDAVIIDVRRNGGGSSEMSHLVFSHFLAAEPVETIKVRRRLPNEPTIRHSMATVPGPRRPDVPLYVLTSQATGSAAEEFAFVLKNQKRAMIVGTRTAGAGHMVTFVNIGNGFGMGLSITRVSDPATGAEWERVGVQPDLAVSAEAALAEAHVVALRAVLSSATDAERKRIVARLLVLAEARRRPVPVDPARLARFAGVYEGRVVSVVDGQLRYARRDGGIAEQMVVLGNDRFAIGAAQFRFGFEGSAVRLSIELGDGTTVSFVKSP